MTIQISQAFLNLNFRKAYISCRKLSWIWIVNLCSKNFSRLSFALSAKQIKEKAKVVALDLRGHGKSFTENDLDLSIEVSTFQIVITLYFDVKFSYFYDQDTFYWISSYKLCLVDISSIIVDSLQRRSGCCEDNVWGFSPSISDDWSQVLFLR